MSNAIAVVTESGFGKTTALGQVPEYKIEGLIPSETFIINIKGKPLPFKGWRKQYIAVPVDGPPATGNYLASSDPQLIAKTISFLDVNRPDIKNVVIDDFQYLMSEEFMANALKTGFDKYNKLAKNAYDVINAGLNMRPEANFFILTHAEETKEGSYKMKTIGEHLPI